MGGPFGCYGKLGFNKGILDDITPLEDGSPFSVAHDVVNTDADGDGFAGPDASGTNQAFLILYSTPSTTVGEGLQPQSVKAYAPSDGGDNDRYWPFVLEQYIEIEDHPEDHWASLEESGVDLASKYGTIGADGIPQIIIDLYNRPSHLKGIVRASEWKAYVEANSSSFAGFTRFDLWKQWSYGLRIVFVPPNRSGIASPDGIIFNEALPGTDIALPKSVDIKPKITSLWSVSDSGLPFNADVRQQNKAFYFTSPTVDATSVSSQYDNPMSIPMAKGTLAMPMDIDSLNSDWSTSFDAIGGFGKLVQELVCSNEYKMLFRYCFNMPRILSVVGIYIIQAFLPSIGRAAQETSDGFPSAGPLDITELPIDIGDKAREFDFGAADDGWYEPKGLSALFSNEYYGGGLSGGFSPLSPLGMLANLATTNFKEWQFYKAFPRTKKLVAQSFMDLYNSENPNYTSDAYGDTSEQEDAKNQLNVSWPKFSLRLWSKQVDRPYDKNGDICYDTEEDYSDE